MLNLQDIGMQIADARRHIAAQEQAVLRNRAAGRDASNEIGQLYAMLDRLTALEVARDWGPRAASAG